MEGLADIRPGEILTYRLGFNVYPSVITERQTWAYSDELTVLIPARQSPYGKFTYPYQFAKGDYPLTDSGDGDFEISGGYQMTLVSPQKQVLEFVTTLTAKNGVELEDNWFYQTYLQVRRGSDFFESFACTMRYAESDSGAFTPQNAIVASACDPLDFSEVGQGNFNALKLKTERCPAEPAYELSFEKSSTTANTVTCAFSRDFE